MTAQSLSCLLSHRKTYFTVFFFLTSFLCNTELEILLPQPSVYVCMWVGVPHACTWKPERSIKCPLLCSLLYSPRWVHSLNLEFSIWEPVWQPEGPSAPPAHIPCCHTHTPPSSGVTEDTPCTAFYLGSKDPSSGSHACKASTPIHRAFLPGHMFLDRVSP